jgi:hypothetical protein
MRALLFCLLGLLAVNVLPLFAVRAVFHSDGPFTARCDGTGGLLSDETVVFIFHDRDRDGPDSTDWVIGTNENDPEGIHANFYTFLLDQQGGFLSGLWSSSIGYDQINIAVYLRIFFGDSRDSCYTSPVVILTGGSTTDSLEFPLSGWACGPALCRVPPCETGGVGLDYGDPSQRDTCAYVCSGSGPSICVRMGPGAGMMRLPVIEVVRGCDSLSAPYAAVTVDVGYWRTFVNPWFCSYYRSDLWGRVTFCLLDSIPYGTLDTLTAESVPPGIHLQWNTTRETDLDSFELWRVWAGSGRAGAIAASGNPEGGFYEFLDTGVAHTGAYGYNLLMVGNDGVKHGAAHVRVVRSLQANNEPEGLPAGFALHPNYPNPFNPSTTISFDLPITTRASVRVYDITGREVSVLADEVLSAGTHTVTFDGGKLPSGIYISRLTVGQFTAARKMILLK